MDPGEAGIRCDSQAFGADSEVSQTLERGVVDFILQAIPQSVGVSGVLLGVTGRQVCCTKTVRLIIVVGVQNAVVKSGIFVGVVHGRIPFLDVKRRCFGGKSARYGIANSL
jgi:hypothetical protein